MELTGLKSFKNAGGSVYSSIGSSDSSKTVGYKLINNLPKFENGTPGLLQSSTSSSTNNTSSTTLSTSNTSSSTGNTSLADNYGGWGNQLFNNSVTTLSFNPGLNVPYSGKVDTSTKYGTNSVKSYFNSPAATAGANITAKVGPSSTGGKGVNWSGIGNVVTSGVQFAGDAINSFSVNETGEEVAQKYGTSQLNVGGIGYESQNMIDLNKEMDRVKSENTGNTLKTVGSGAALGAAAGSIIPGLGTIAGGLIGAGVGLITGIFGGEARKREYRRLLAKQNSKINALQDSARFSAQTKAIQLQNAREYGDSESLYLYGAKEGKQPEVNPNTGMTKNDFLLATPNGYKIGKANSLVEPGETLFDTKTGSMMQVPRQIGSKLHPGDILPAEIPEYAAVFTDRHEDPNTGKSFALAAIDGDDDPYNLLYRQKVLVNDKKNNKGLMKAKNGRLPRYAGGRITFNPNDLILDAATLADIKKSSYRKEDSFISHLEIMKQNASNPTRTIKRNGINVSEPISSEQEKAWTDSWKNTIAPTNPTGTVGGLVDPYAINKNFKSPTGTESYGNDDNSGVGKWFTSPLDNLPYYFSMGTAALHGLFRDRRIHTPQTKVAMPEGLDELYALRMNPYPIMLNNIKIQDKMKKAVLMSGGLNAAQKALAYMAAQYNTQLNNSKVLADAQIQDNAYKSDATKTRLNAMAAYDQRRVAQNNFIDDMYARGHAANQKMDIDDLTTFSTAWQNANKNTFNSRVYRWMMDQYAQELKAKRKNGKWIV